MLLEHGAEARALAGGTDLVVKMKQRRLVPRVVVNLKRIPNLDYVRVEPGRGLRIGALATLEMLNRSIDVRKRYPVLHDAVSCMGTLEIRNRGTVAGNLCNASPAAETIPGLMVLGARAILAGPSGARSIAVDELILGPGRTALEAGELLIEIEVPEPPPLHLHHQVGAYDKYSLRRMDLAVVGAAVLLELDGLQCKTARIVLSAVGPTAFRASDAEAQLANQPLDEAIIRTAAHAAAAQASPKADLTGTVESKRAAAEALVQRVIRQALSRAGMRTAS